MTDFSKFLKESFKELGIQEDEDSLLVLGVSKESIISWFEGVSEPCTKALKEEVVEWVERKLRRHRRIDKNKETGKFQVWAYGMQGSDDMCDGEHDTLEEALHVVRREWPYPMKIVLPNGDDYNFSKLEEFRFPVIYKYMVLKKTDNLQAHQKHLLKEIKDDPDLKFFLSLMKRRPQNYDSIVASCEPAIRTKQMDKLLALIACDLIEFVDFHDGSGIVDRKWR